jgi:hypothetical protein
MEWPLAMSRSSKDEIDSIAEGVIEQSYCTKVDDLFTPATCDLIGRYLGNFLNQLVITPTELVHSAKYQKRLHDAGRTLMNAVDKVGTFQARHKSENVTTRIRDLHDLVSDASRKVWDDERERPIPAVKPETFADAIDQLPAGERSYLGNRILTEHLSQHKVWKDKIEALLRILSLCDGRAAYALVEFQLGETVRREPALDHLLGMTEYQETRCNELVDLWKGVWPENDNRTMAKEIAALIAADKAPTAKAAFESTLLRTLSGKMPLRSNEPRAELQSVFNLAKRMWVDQLQAPIGGTKTLTLLEKRQSRHLNAEGVTDILREQRVLADRLLALTELAGMAIGQASRGVIKTFVDHYFGNRDLIPRLLSGQEQPVPKLQTLTQIHRALKASWLAEEDKARAMTQIESAQADLVKRSRLFEQIEKKAETPAQKALTLIDLCRKATFIEGPTLDNVRLQAQAYMRDPQFLPGYLAGAEGEERERKLSLLTRTLATLGIPLPM